MVWQLRIWRDISEVEVPPWGGRGPHLKTGCPAHGTSARKRSPDTIWLWKSVRIAPEWNRASGVPGVTLEGPMHGLTHKLTSSGLQCRGSSSKSQGRMERNWTDYLQGEGWRDRGSGQLPLGTKELAATPDPLLRTLPNPAGRWRQGPNLSPPLTWLISFTQPWWFPKTLSHPDCAPGLSHSQCFSTQVYFGSLRTILKSPKGLQTPNKHCLASAYLVVPFAK